MVGSSLVVRPIRSKLGETRALAIDALLAAFFKGKSENTLRSYQLDLEDFARFLMRWMNLPIGISAREALQLFLMQGAGSANEIGVHYVDDLEQRGLSSSTTNRHLAALKSIVRFGRLIGMVAWTLEVRGRPVERVRETRGPSAATTAQLLEHLAALDDFRGRRDYAMVRLMVDVGLRVTEVVRLDVADLDEAEGTVLVLGKGRRAKQRITLPRATQLAIAKWLLVRGCHEGPLLTRSRASLRGPEGGRLVSRSAYRQVRLRGREIGIRLHPHALRHTAITVAVEQARKNDIGIEEVLQFSRHKNLQTLLIYRDKTRDVQGQLASLVSSHLDEGPADGGTPWRGRLPRVNASTDRKVPNK